MKEEYRKTILDNLKDGEERSKGIPWELRKLICIGVTNDGFPYVVWKTENFSIIQVGISRSNIKPHSKIRNDASCYIKLYSFRERQQTAELMSKMILV